MTTRCQGVDTLHDHTLSNARTEASTPLPQSVIKSRGAHHV